MNTIQHFFLLRKRLDKLRAKLNYVRKQVDELSKATDLAEKQTVNDADLPETFVYTFEGQTFFCERKGGYLYVRPTNILTP